MKIYLSLTTPALPSLRASGAPAQGRRRELGDAERRPCDAFSRLEGGPAVRPLPRAQEEALLVLRPVPVLDFAAQSRRGSARTPLAWRGAGARGQLGARTAGMDARRCRSRKASAPSAHG